MKIRVLVLSLSMLSACAIADDQPMFKFSGYGTLGAAHSTNNEADYRTNYFQPDGSARNHNWDPNLDSKAGVQADAFLIGKILTATVQVQSARRYDHTYTPALEWANLKYQPVESFYLRAGRVVAPVFMNSENRNVGYTLTAIRPPADVYFINPMSRIDGLDTGYKFTLGPVMVNSQLAGGVYKDKLASTTSPNIETEIRAGLFNTTFEYEDTTVRIGAGRLRVTNDNSTIANYKASLAALSATYPSQIASLQESTSFDKQYVSIYGIGFNYDPGKWFILGEYAGRKGHTDTIQSAHGWYGLAGYRVGKFTPYAGYSQVRSTEDFDATVLPQTSVAAGLVNAVNADLRLKLEQSTTTAGVRYDFWKNLALKAQLEYIHKPAGANGTFYNYRSGFSSGARNVGLTSIALDFVF